MRSANRILPLSSKLHLIVLFYFCSIPKLKPARALPVPTTRKSTLSNQLVVATEETYGQVLPYACRQVLSNCIILGHAFLSLAGVLCLHVC